MNQGYGVGAKIEVDKEKTDRKALEQKAGEGQTKKKHRENREKLP